MLMKMVNVVRRGPIPVLNLPIFGHPVNNFSNSIGLSLDLSNNFEAKVRDKDSTKTEPKKIILLNNFNFNTAYNFAADSLNWAPTYV